MAYADMKAEINAKYLDSPKEDLKLAKTKPFVIFNTSPQVV